MVRIGRASISSRKTSNPFKVRDVRASHYTMQPMQTIRARRCETACANSYGAIADKTSACPPPPHPVPVGPPPPPPPSGSDSGGPAPGGATDGTAAEPGAAASTAASGRRQRTLKLLSSAANS